MHSRAGVGLPIFRSEGQARLLADVLLAEEWRSLSELARRTGLAPSTVQREVERLQAAGIVVSRRVGNVRQVRADPSSRFHDELRGLVEKAFGPEPVLESELRRVDGIEAAYLFGSWARRLRGRGGGEPPGDIDVLVVGSPDPGDVYSACMRAERNLGIAVDPVVVSPEEWSDASAGASLSGFLAAVRAEEPISLAVRGA